MRIYGNSQKRPLKSTTWSLLSSTWQIDRVTLGLCLKDREKFRGSAEPHLLTDAQTRMHL